MKTPEKEVPRLIDINEVSQQTALGKSTLRCWVKLGRFPAGYKVSKSKTLWLQSDINEWILRTTQRRRIPSLIGGSHDCA